MTSFDPEHPSDSESHISGDGQELRFSNGGSQGLGLLVWLGQLARDDSTSRPTKSGVTESQESPRKVGRFEIECLLGTGAYGAVFRALDSHLGRKVALKLAWPGVLMDPVASRRFVEEPKIVATLKHRGIVEVYDSGEIDMAFFIALELVDGPTLGQWFKDQETLDGRLAAQIICSVAETVHHAHTRGVIHRDLKPSNILLRPATSSRSFSYEPVVTDFGLARGPSLSGLSMATATRAIIGTDQYMSPEQASGRNGEIGPASDVFSLGVILYELVAGRRPFDGESAEQIRLRIQEEEPPAIRPWRKSVPKDLETIIVKCLDKAPRGRYASAQHLADDLGRFLSNEPIHARPIRFWQRGWKYAKRKPLVVSLMSLAIFSAFLLAAMAVNHISAARQVALAEAATAAAEGIERQHQYASGIHRASDALDRSGRREVMELLEECRSLAYEPVRCGIEWDFLWAQANDATRILAAHPGGVRSLRFSSTGDILISAGADGKVFLWDTSTWTKRSELDDGVGEVKVAVPSPDDTLLAVGGDDGRIVVHRLEDGARVFDLAVVEGRVFDLAWLGRGGKFAVAGDGAVLHVVDPVSGECRSTAPLPVSEEHQRAGLHRTTEISGLAYLPTRNAVAVCTMPPMVHFVDIDSLAVVESEYSLAGVGNLCTLGLPPNYLVEVGTSMIIHNVDNGTVVAAIAVPPAVRSLRYSPTAGILAAALGNGIVHTWDVKSLVEGRDALVQRLCAHSGRALTLDFSPDAKCLASGGLDGQIKLWNPQSLRQPFNQSLEFKPTGIAFSPDGQRLMISGTSTEEAVHFVMFDARSGYPLWTYRQPLPKELRDNPLDFAGWPLAFDPTGAQVVFQDLEKIVTRDSRTGVIVSTSSNPGGPRVARIWFSPDGKSLTINLGNLECFQLVQPTGQIIEHSAEHGSRCLGMFRTIRGDGMVQMEDSSRNCLLRPSLATPPLLTLAGPSELLQFAAVSHDGRYLAAGGYDRIIYLWDLEQGGPPRKLVGHDDSIIRLCFSPDGRTILSHSTDGSVRFWHVPTRAEVIKLGSPQEPIVGMDLNPAGNLLVIGVEHGKRFGLQVFRLGTNRESLPRHFDLPPSQAP